MRMGPKVYRSLKQEWAPMNDLKWPKIEDAPKVCSKIESQQLIVGSASKLDIFQNLLW